MTDCVWINPENLSISDKICAIANHYGIAHQLGKAAEECIELVDAINHKNPEGIKEEIADVQIMLWELEELYGYDPIDEIKRKLNRQLKRMEAENDEAKRGNQD